MYDSDPEIVESHCIDLLLPPQAVFHLQQKVRNSLLLEAAIQNYTEQRVGVSRCDQAALHRVITLAHHWSVRINTANCCFPLNYP